MSLPDEDRGNMFTNLQILGFSEVPTNSETYWAEKGLERGSREIYDSIMTARPENRAMEFLLWATLNFDKDHLYEFRPNKLWGDKARIIGDEYGKGKDFEKFIQHAKKDNRSKTWVKLANQLDRNGKTIFNLQCDDIKQDIVQEISVFQSQLEYGEIAYENGDLYLGEFKNIVREGKGTLTTADFKYEGGFKNGKIHGYGEIKFAKGDEYKGQWKNGLKEGEGIYTWSIGDIYDGFFLNDKIHGYGQFKYASGDVYKGQWYNDKKEGKGELKYATGDLYEGEFKNNMFNGHGVMKHANGDKYIGNWKDFKKYDKKAEYIYANGNKVYMEWVNNELIRQWD